MSIKSTHEIKRSLAIEAIEKYAKTCSNEVLGNILDELTTDIFKNFIVINDDDNFGNCWTLKDIKEFNNAKDSNL